METKKENPLLENITQEQRLGLQLKIEKIVAEYIGKSQFYVTAAWDGEKITVTAR